MGILGTGGSLPIVIVIILILLWLFGGPVKILVMGFVMRVHNVADEDVAKYVLGAPKDVDNALMRLIRALTELVRACRGSESEKDDKEPDAKVSGPPRELPAAEPSSDSEDKQPHSE